MQGAAVDHGIGVGTLRVDRERTLGEGVGDLTDVLLRQVEDHRNRLDLGDDDDGRRTRRMHDIAFVHLPDAGAPIDRRDDRGVAERRLRVLDRRLVGLHQRGILRDQCFLGVGLLVG